MPIIARPFIVLGRSVAHITRRVRRGQRGASAVEYAIMASLIAAVVITAVAFMGNKTSSSFTCTGTSITAGTNKC